MDDILLTISVWALPVLLAVTLHEAAHGWVAWKLGDDTAKRLGRVTFNPLKHVDPVGTVILPAALLLLSGGRMMFGFAKPVPVNFLRLGHPRRDMVLVAAAGPGINLVFAYACMWLLYATAFMPAGVDEWVFANLQNGIAINLILAVLNMLPVPPLDGGRVAVGLLPVPLARPLARLEPFGFFLILGAFFILPMAGRAVGVQLDVFGTFVLEPAMVLRDILAMLAGFEVG